MCNNELQASTAGPISCWNMIDRNSKSFGILLTFSLRIHNRSCYASLLPKDLLPKKGEERNARRQDLRPRWTGEAREDARDGDDDDDDDERWNGGDDGRLFLPERHRENRPGEPRGTERYPTPSSAANPRGRDVDTRDTGVPLPGFLCASADRPKPVYGTSPRSPAKGR